jgi:acetoin utilization deacetylase AcuC-like enzyme
LGILAGTGRRRGMMRYLTNQEGGSEADHDFPLVVCLCGSTRFMEAFRRANFIETMAGHIVLTVGCDTKSDDELKLSVADKVALDALHKRKIDLADEILVLNVGGYIGESTRSEIDYAVTMGRAVRYLEPLPESIG